MPKVVLDLLVHPTLGGRAERQRPPDGHLRADPGAAIQNALEGLPTHPRRLGRLRDRHFKGFQAQFPEYVSCVRRVVHLHGATSVVVFVVDALGIFAGKTERDAPIPAKPHSPGAFSSALQLIEVQPREAQVARVGRCVQFPHVTLGGGIDLVRPIDCARLDFFMTAALTFQQLSGPLPSERR